MEKRKETGKIKFSNAYVFIALLFFILIIYRMYNLSTSSEIDGINLQQFANNRITRQEELLAKRGTVYDVLGNTLAQNVSSYTLIAYLSSSRTTDLNSPKHVIDIDYTAEQLATVLDISVEQLKIYLSKENVYQTEFGSKGRGLTELTKDAILELELPGIGFIATQKRYYPYGDFLSYTLGYARLKEETISDDKTIERIKGEMGIELQYDEKLTGQSGYILYQKDRSGYKIAGTKEVKVDPIDGKDIYITIDSNIQLFVEQAIKKSDEKYNFDWMTVMLADAKTGKILASATSPSFDPNKRNITNYLDYNVSYAYEPGSTMKIFSYMAAMENGIYNGSELYKSGIFIAKDGTQIGDWHRKGWGNISYDAGFALSSNVAVMNLISKYMNGTMLKEYYNRLGFGQKTGIELPNEANGKLNFKYETEILNAGFGQGITTTPIQNVKALTALTNDGILLQPYIIDKIVDPVTNEIVYQGGRKELERVASTKTVDKIKELMRSVVNGNSTNSTGHYYYMKGYDFIAKTGTAQIAKENGSGYSDKVIKAITGMFPGNDPEVIIYIAAKNPSGDGVAPMKVVVQDIIKNVSKYLNIYDEDKAQEQQLKEYTLESVINKNINDISNKLITAGMKVVVIGSGDKIIKQYPSSGTVVNEIDKIFLVTESKEIKMVDLKGYSIKEFWTFANLVNIKAEVEGNGYLYEQSIKVGTIIPEDATLEVKFKLK